MCAARHVDEWVRADLRFHLGVLAAGGNELLMSLGALIARTLEAQLHLNAKRADVFNASLDEHTRVVDAIRARRDGGAARHHARADRALAACGGWLAAGGISLPVSGRRASVPWLRLAVGRRHRRHRFASPGPGSFAATRNP
ncbi:MAG: hypothetical protein GAK41_01436 [Burkholderia gladioli]|nr:MAG: hypothetical protein GAK41_01436 [Burkholderia gladioli]